MSAFPPRIHVLLARDAPVGVVIRRGPSKSVCTMLWDRFRDTFQLGQWLRGRIYERRSDLSRDGRCLIYFAMNGKWDSEARGSWTAISRAPYLKAIALFPKGDCWHGGGLFTDNDTYWLNEGCDRHTVLRDSGELRRNVHFHPSEDFGAECLSVYYPRLLRDGWQLVARRVEPKDCEEPLPCGWILRGYVAPKNFDVFEKQLPADWILRKIAHVGASLPGKGCYWDEHELLYRPSETCIPCPDWEWADLDGNRLVWAASGKLWTGRLEQDALRGETELADFNGMTFEPIAAPY